MRRSAALLATAALLGACQVLPGMLGLKAFPRQTFACADVSGNGRLEGAEAERITWTDGSTGRETSAGVADLAAADRNGDGGVTLEEWSAYYAGARFDKPRCAPPPVAGATPMPGADVPNPVVSSPARTPSPAATTSPATSPAAEPDDEANTPWSPWPSPPP